MATTSNSNQLPVNFPVGEELRIMLLGKTGSGKSCLGNALLGEPAAFLTSQTGQWASATDSCKKESRLTRGRFLNVVDTPGTMDTKQPETALRQLSRAIAMFAEGGVHAFVITLRLDVRFTTEEEAAVRLLGELFGERFFRYAIIAFTHGDVYENDNQRFFAAVQTASQQLPGLKELLRLCGERIVMMDNGPNRNAFKQSEQTYNLVCSIDQLVKSNARMEDGQRAYLNEFFVLAQRAFKNSGTAANGARDNGSVEALNRASDEVYNNMRGSSCFPPDATVLTPQGRVRLSDLSVGQPVLTLQDGQPAFSPVYMWGHRDLNGCLSDFVTLSTESARLTLSSDHLVFAATTASVSEKLTAVPAGRVRPGFALRLLFDVADSETRLETVVAVERGVFRRGLLAPFTLNGCIVVDGVLASCYIGCLPHRMSHALLAPVRALWQLAPNVANSLNRVDCGDNDTGSNNDIYAKGMPGWVRMACNRLLPALSWLQLNAPE